MCGELNLSERKRISYDGPYSLGNTTCVAHVSPMGCGEKMTPLQRINQIETKVLAAINARDPSAPVEDLEFMMRAYHVMRQIADENLGGRLILSREFERRMESHP